jgi:imidazole glycerol-phosphate synthase subunit HisH
MAAVTIVDYGVGNVAAFEAMYRKLGITCTRGSTPDSIRGAQRLILPGVGSFDWAMERLAASGLLESLEEAVVDARVPVLGVCVGLQMMCLESSEGSARGLGWLEAGVERLAPPGGQAQGLKLPHMGWNDVEASAHWLFRGVERERFYFLHSYAVKPLASIGLATARYGDDFVVAAGLGNILGVQFHPEKSHASGAKLLSNFARGLEPEC